MTLFTIAFRYLFSKKQFHIINIISLITAITMLLATAVLFSALSIFSGIETLVKSMYSTLSSDMQITVNKGKTFLCDETLIDSLYTLDGVTQVFKILEDNVLVENEKKQHLCLIRGVEQSYYEIPSLKRSIFFGNNKFENGDIPYALIGKGVSLILDIKPYYRNPLWIYAPMTGQRIDVANPVGSFRKDYIFVSGIFAIEYDTDTRYIFAPLSFAQSLLNCPNQLTSIEITLNTTQNLKTVRQQVEKFFPESDFTIKSKDEQNATLFKVFRNEQWALFFILFFILLMAGFNAVSSIAMHIITKSKEIITLKSMGFSLQQVRKIFLLQGCIIFVASSILGTMLGLLACWAQTEFGFLSLEGNFVVDRYPVVIQPFNVLLVLLSVNLIGIFTTSIPVFTLLNNKKYYT